MTTSYSSISVESLWGTIHKKLLFEKKIFECGGLQKQKKIAHSLSHKIIESAFLILNNMEEHNEPMLNNNPKGKK